MSLTDNFKRASEEISAGTSRGAFESPASSPAQITPTPSASHTLEKSPLKESSPSIRLLSSTPQLGESTSSSSSEGPTAAGTPSRSVPLLSSSSSWAASELTRSTSREVVTTVVKTAFRTETHTRPRPASSVPTTSTTEDSIEDTDGAIVAPTGFDPSPTGIPTSQPSTDPPPAAQASSPPGRPEEHPPLSNGATAGIVLAVVAVLLGTFFLVRYIYKRRGFCGRGRPFSPIQEPYHRPTPGSISGPYQQHPPGHPWIHHPGAQSYPSVVVTPSREEEVELQTFTRPMHGPRMYDVGHSGNAPLAPPYDGHDAQGHAPAHVPPQQAGQDMPVSPESPTPSGRAHDGGIASPRSRAGALPWEEGYRYRAW